MTSAASQRRDLDEPVILIIRDGWGENPHPGHDPFNAVKRANTPVDDALRRDWPWTLIRTCGEDVGLPTGVMGNSEVGHQNIGAGRIVDQELMRITRAIREGGFFENPALKAAFAHAVRNGSNLHIMGLVSDGRVHSDLEHLFALIDMAKREAFPAKRLFIHAFTDGRDTGPRTGLGFIERLEAKLKEAGVGRIASVIGRYYAMDRDHRWERVEQAYSCLTNRAGRDRSSSTAIACTSSSASGAIKSYYEHPTDESRRGDEFIPPAQIVDSNGTPLPRVSDGDAVIFFNFRGDRPREIVKAFVLDDDAWRNVKGDGFDRGRKLENLFFCGMTMYEEGLPMTAVAFHKPPKMKNILGEVVSKAGLAQFRCAETEKFPHVTFFFNDYREEPFEGEHRLLLPSPKDVSTYDQKPQMSAPEVCAGVIERLRSSNCEALLVVNFANADMVGHTGSLAAATRAVEMVDECTGRIIDAALARGGSLIITADHGNAEQMWDPATDSPHTAHTTYDVPLYVVSESARGARLRAGGRLADVAPTVLHLMGIEPPREMTGRSLIEPSTSHARRKASHGQSTAPI